MDHIWQELSRQHFKSVMLIFEQGAGSHLKRREIGLAPSKNAQYWFTTRIRYLVFGILASREEVPAQRNSLRARGANDETLLAFIFFSCLFRP